MRGTTEFATYNQVVFFDVYSLNGDKYTVLFDFGAKQIQLSKNDQNIKTWT